ncbi:MAG: 30S ribosomal protein S6 [Candidatus Eisenbacteria bacterium]|uniref:Small ribosomal subunit protein bS6 n=1 Tax=Eiseniibacteriota bacterium TaxID=2212470 RepID=A0A538T7Q0_UNCEI|nr:MAG: 30S ribosomal protein S6 [Candidatus Eisenbacteria bacterium]
MKIYETTIIFDPGLEEARINDEVERLSQSIGAAGGEVIEVQRWGKRKLAYNIRKRRDGTYIHIKHKSPPELIGEMDRRFRLNESVLRHLTVLAAKESPRTAEEPGRVAETAAAGAETASTRREIHEP